MFPLFSRCAGHPPRTVLIFIGVVGTSMLVLFVAFFVYQKARNFLGIIRARAIANGFVQIGLFFGLGDGFLLGIGLNAANLHTNCCVDMDVIFHRVLVFSRPAGL